MENLKLYRTLQGRNLFEEEITVEALSALGNPLEVFSALIDFELFRPTLEDVLLNKNRKSNASRPQIDVVLMFKVIVLQRYYGLGDHQIEYQIVDRTSFRQFLGIQTVSDIPDEKTVWACREKLVQAGAFDTLFDDFRRFLDEKGSKGHPLTEEQIKSNRTKSKVRCRVEHVYGFFEGAMHGNVFRFCQISRLQPELIKTMG